MILSDDLRLSWAHARSLKKMILGWLKDLASGERHGSGSLTWRGDPPGHGSRRWRVQVRSRSERPMVRIHAQGCSRSRGYGGNESARLAADRGAAAGHLA